MISHWLVALAILVQASPPPIRPTPVLPEDSKPAYRAHLPPTCSQWREARAGTDVDSRYTHATQMFWVLGYVTAFNMVGPDPAGDWLNGGSREELEGAITAYCGRNPKSLVSDAMRPFAEAYVRRRQQVILGANSVAPKATTRGMTHVTTTCGNWVESRSNRSLRAAYIQMLQGYLTAYNRFGPDPTGDAIGAQDGSFIEEIVDKWCSARPSVLLIGAATALVDQVASDRAAGRLPPGGMRANDRWSAAPVKKR